MHQNNSELIIGLFPDLFDEGFTFECGSGWGDLILNVCVSVRDYCEKEGIPPLKFSQIKEKFGLLRIYIGGHPTIEVYRTIDKYESMSGSVCEFCGEPGSRTDYSKKSWIKTLCDKHKEDWYNSK